MLDALTWFSLLILPAFLALDFFVSARKYVTPRGWRLKALLVSTGVFFLSLKVGEWWGAWTGGIALFDGTALGTAGGALVGILVYELFHYGYHRFAHSWKPLWRAAHQMHHSAESLDAFGANYLHPLDVFFFTSLASLAFFPLLGLSPEAGAIASAFLAFNAAFQHANIKTPRWLGYLVQRPESHAVHHGRGTPRANYADLPLWDMVFGTFRNPETVEGQMGFYDGASDRIPEMLVGLDVTRPRGAAARSAAGDSPARATVIESRRPERAMVGIGR